MICMEQHILDSDVQRPASLNRLDIRSRRVARLPSRARRRRGFKTEAELLCQ